MRTDAFERWLWRLAIVTLPLGTAWVVTFGAIGGLPWSLGNLALGLGESILVAAVLFAALRGAVRFPGKSGIWLLVWAGLLAGGLMASPEPFAGIFMLARYVLVLVLCRTAIPLSVSEIRFVWALGVVVPCVAGFAQVMLAREVIASTLLGIAWHPLAAPGTSVVEVAGERLMRAYGTFAHPNIFGAYLVLSLMVLAKDERAGVRVAQAASGFMLALTMSRSALLAFALWALVSRGKRTGMAIAGCCVGMLLLLPAYGVRFGGNEGRLEQRSTVERVSSWRDGFELFIAHPVTGVGVLQSVPMLAVLHPDAKVWDVEPAHAAPLLALAEWGIFGVIAFAALLAASGFTLSVALVPFAPIFLLDHMLLTSGSLMFLAALAWKAIPSGYERAS